MTGEKLPAFVQALLNPSVYPHPARDIHLVQTHISYVIVSGDFVYKFKKDVDFGFLDFSTLAKRKYFCEQELKLNRRLCPDIYLEVVRVFREDDKYNLEGRGEVVEYGVKMVRMPEERMMVKVVRADELRKDHLDKIVRILVPFYEQAEQSPHIDRFGSAEAVGKNVLDNFAQTREFIGDAGLPEKTYADIYAYAKKFLARKELFASRVDAGRIRDCHGDLYSANICLADKVYIYDCIEFNQRLRYCDVASDVAFLAMDLDFYGLHRLSEYFIDRFGRKSGDRELWSMLDFYKCYRAYVRGKIGLITANDAAVANGVRQQNLEAAKKYFQLARQYATGYE